MPSSSFLIADVAIPVSIVFDDSVLPFLVEGDRNILQHLLSSSFPHGNSSLSAFSIEFRRCLYAICGADSASVLQVDPASCTRKCLCLDHLEERPVKFFLRHISGLPEWTKGRPNKGSTGDHVVVERVLEPPYLQGDYKAASPKGAMDFAITATLRDSVWINAVLGFVSQEYRWEKLYLAEAGAYRQCLDSTIRFGMGDDKRTYAQSGTKFKSTASASVHALKEISNLHQNTSVALIGPKCMLVRPGMGVVVDPPLDARALAANVETVFGTVKEIDHCSKTLTIRVLLGCDNLPEYVLGKLGPNELLQTNATLVVPFHWVAGTFRVWPAQLFQADCIPMKSESGTWCKFLSRIIVCDLEFVMDDAKSSGEIAVSFDIFSKLLQGELRLTVSRMKPFPPQAALAYLYFMHELDGGLNPPATAYKDYLAHELKMFALKKAAHAKNSKDQLSIRVNMPGPALMELLYRTVAPEHRIVSISNGNMFVEVQNLEALHGVFGLVPEYFNLRDSGFGIMQFHGPYTFKWSMYDTLEVGGPLSGSVSFSVGSYTEYSRMGPPDVIKSSRCHPDALRGSSVKIPAEKKARASTKSCGTGSRKQTSRGPEQAQERLERHVKRMALEGKLDAGSQAESTGESTSDERVVVRGFSCQPPHISDSQSGEELPLGGPEL
jgi:hypothetical protein